MNRLSQTVSPAQGRITGGYLGDIVKRVQDRLLSYQWRILNDEVADAEPSHCIDNFRIAAGAKTGAFYGMVFQDSDFGKWLEALGYKLMSKPDAELEALADEVIGLMEKAQLEDGYLNTYFICTDVSKRWTNLRDCHELYCAGHLLEGAIAYTQATGRKKALEIMTRVADCICDYFGRQNLEGYPGHAEIELALCRLYDVTGEKRYLDMAQSFLERRGREPYYFAEEQKKVEKPFFPHNESYGRAYAQSHLPVREQFTLEGHAVRALYLACGAADVALRTGDEALFEACRRQFNNLVSRRMYITGGVGSTYVGEALTFDYDLPDDTAYAETCASVALIFFAHRMLRGELNGVYADAMERALYNTCLSGMSLDQERFFYVNPLAVVPEADEKDPSKQHILPERQRWLSCACCPPNLARLLCSLTQYQLTIAGKEICVHLYLQSDMEVQVGGQPVRLAFETEYPAQGRVRIRVSPGDYALKLHIPAWCESFRILRGGRQIDAQPVRGYACVEGPFEEEDIVLDMEMAPRICYAHPKVRSAAGKAAVAYGPLVYCAEEVDNGADLHQLLLVKGAPLSCRKTEELGGTMIIETDGMRESAPQEDDLYYTGSRPQREKVRIRLIPYHKWCNRGKNEMLVWLRETD